jgi:hypothetical protein
MEEQDSLLTDKLAKLNDMMMTMASIQATATAKRESELAQIEKRFEANGKQLNDVAAILAKLQISVDRIDMRMPDDNPSKARQVLVAGAATD